MISRAMLKSEIDKVKAEYLELLYQIVKAFENGTSKKNLAIASKSQDFDITQDWQGFIDSTYGCMADSHLSRAEQGILENREEIQ